MFSYLYNKAFATFIRYIGPKTAPANPDEVLQIPSRDAGRTIKTHVYRPAHQQQQTPTKPSPVLINMHGSGFILYMHGEDDAFCRRIANETDSTVLDLSYRLAPEHPFPAAPNDAEDVAKWVLSQPEVFDQTRISLSGFSAGANLALGLSGVTFPPDTFRSVIAFYPPTDISRDRKDPSAQPPDPSGGDIPGWMSTLFNDCYAPAPLDRRQPLLSPLYCEVERLPERVLFVTCAKDGLCYEGEELAEKIEGCKGGKVVRRRVPCQHAWDKKAEPGSVEEKARDEMYELAVEMLRS